MMRPGGEYSVEQDGHIVEQGKNDLYTKAGVSISMPVVRKKGLFVLASVKYSNIHQEFNHSTQLLDYGFGATTHHIFSTNAIVSGGTKLFGKTVKIMGMINGEYSQYGFERWMAMGTAVVMLKETANSEFGVGIIGMVNTFSKIPVFPLFTYRHTFNERWTLNIAPPIMQMRYTINPRNAVTFGMNFNADHYFIHPGTPDLPERVRYNRSMLNLGAVYEHKFSSKLTAVVDLGFSAIITDRISKSGGSSKIAEVDEKNTPYCRFAIQQRF